MILTGQTIQNQKLCRDHFRLSLRMNRFESAGPGQFVHLCPAENIEGVIDYRTPLLRRAYSIAALRRQDTSVELDVIYRVVGSATRWMQSLTYGNPISVLGPQGNRFPIEPSKPIAWLVSGGVGLPPMLWLAEALAKAGKNVVAFCGAQSADLLPLTIRGDEPPSTDAGRATLSATEFAQSGVPVIVSTDDGSLGFHGHICAAMTAFHKASLPSSDDL
ncbi:MAG: siderophore-interacting protein, partial [Planctomycetes bacterium]|nr:siderophore-interacting protein [Planctomycetota bacterium]